MAEAAVTTSLKKLINPPASEVKDALAGMAAAHGDLIRVEYDPNVIIRKDAPKKGKVGLVSGGGSGHEPMHGGYVGLGMLDAACPGAVFTSPTPDQMARATKAVDGGAGVLHVVKNYTGDIMNFEMAAELARGEGAKVNAVITNDDVAVQDSLYTAGRRGVGVTVLLEKIVGGAAEAGYDLEKATELAKKVNANGRSMGMALTSCIVPAAGKVTFVIADDEMELGIGIQGRRRDCRDPDQHRGQGPAIQARRRGDRLCQRHGRYTPDRALRRSERRQSLPSERRDQAGPLAGGLVHHVTRDGGLLGHAPEAR
jgi:dihydroxyacetone kinase-like protein